MPKSKLTVSFYLPTTSISRLKDAMDAVVTVLEGEHKARDFFTQIEGPFRDGYYDERVNSNGKKSEGGDGLGRSADGPGPGPGIRAVEPPADGGDFIAPVEPAKRGRGRPRKEGTGKAEGDGQQSGEPVNPDARQDARRDEPVGTRQGSGEGSDSGQKGQRSPGRSGDDQHGDSQASRLSPDDWGSDDWGSDNQGDDWGSDGDAKLSAAEAANLPGDEWPDYLTPNEIDKTVLNTLLGDHYRATGGKDRGLTYEVMDQATGARQINQVDARDYPKLAKAILKDIARYENGLKKPK